MRPKQRLAFLVGCLAITALAGPRSAANLWRGLRGPYVDAPKIEVAAEASTEWLEEEFEAR